VTRPRTTIEAALEKMGFEKEDGDHLVDAEGRLGLAMTASSEEEPPRLAPGGGGPGGGRLPVSIPRATSDAPCSAFAWRTAMG
jgi:hypothetical protein